MDYGLEGEEVGYKWGVASDRSGSGFTGGGRRSIVSTESAEHMYYEEPNRSVPSPCLQ